MYELGMMIVGMIWESGYGWLGCHAKETRGANKQGPQIEKEVGRMN